jgi:adenylate cyclase
MNLRDVFSELRRRRVFKVTGIYAIVAWIVVQVAATTFPVLMLPEWTVRLVIALVLLGIPVVVVLAWIFDITPEGIERTGRASAGEGESPTPAPAGPVRSARRLPAWALAVLVLAALGMGIYRYAPLERSRPDGDAALSSPAEELDRSIAVLPFVAMSSGRDDEFFADGLTEEILNSLAALPGLLVTARTSAFYFKGKDLPVPEIARALGVAHVVEGSVRRSGERLRVTAQLIRAGDGFHLWSSTFDRDMRDVFAVQEEIAHRVAEALDLVLDEESHGRMASAGVRDPEAFIAFQKGYALFNQAHDGRGEFDALLEQANTFFAEARSRASGFMAAHFYHADRYAHLLLDAAAGEPDHEFTREQLAAMERQLRADLHAAHAAAASSEQRAMIAFNRVLLSDDWTGLAEIASEALAARGCVTMMYVGAMSPLGQAQEVADFFHRQILCSPLEHDLLTSYLPALIWAGRPGDALQLAEEYERRIGPSLHFDRARYLGHLALEDVRAAERGLAAPTMAPALRDLLRVQLLASAGRQGEALEAAAEVRDGGRLSDSQLLLLAAWTGDRASANAAAGRIDARPLGATQLANATMRCYCGSPFDLEATPNLRRALDDGGLEWAPPSPLRFPGKSW